ncbi:kinase-like protein [Calocera viscosa TUFC12733]|uniref:Kinase-like protein n=1 Tax=Calocera viscosa (strain TUFC12733) TaxID=1330018 RepID=A0A167IAR6_CALVF|nr:kinase-like protein [Calocera viscosa TUFC12733]
MSVIDDRSPSTGPLDCVQCSTRIDACIAIVINHAVQHAQDWASACHIYTVFPIGMNFNEQIQIDHSPESLYSTRTARVYRAEHKGRGLVAVKILWENAAPGRLLQLTIRESWTWSQLHHDHIVPLWGVADVSQIATGFGFEPQLCMISPWMIEGNIMGFLKRNPDANRLRLVGHSVPQNKSSKAYLTNQLWDIVKGVDYLHSFKPHKIIHGDLKGQFSDSTTTAYRGNPRWLAFERLDPVKFGAINAQDAHSTQSDVFEMMRTFLQVLTGQEPFHDITNEMAVINKVHQGSNPLRPSGPINGLNEAMWNLMVLSWNHDRMERPSLSVIWETMETFVLEDALLVGYIS